MALTAAYLLMREPVSGAPPPAPPPSSRDSEWAPSAAHLLMDEPVSGALQTLHLLIPILKRRRLSEDGWALAC